MKVPELSIRSCAQQLY